MIEIPRLPDEIRTSLPLEAQAYIAALEAVILELQAELPVLHQQVSELQARTRQTSRNSSRPPSSDPPNTPPRPARPASPRKRGAQPGHRRHERQLRAVEEVDEVVEHHPQQCPACQAPLPRDLPAAAAPVRQQVWEIPVVQPHVTEHRYHQVVCPHCQEAVVAPRPAAVPAGMFGPSVVAWAGLLHGRYRQSMREITALLADGFHLPLGGGSVSNLCQVLSAALASPYQECQDAVTTAASNKVDETGWKQAGRRRWLWVAVNVVCTLFWVATRRNAKALWTLLGATFAGWVTSDRFKAYLTVTKERRQLCWAHLQRNWQAFSEVAGPVGVWGRQALSVIRRLFHLWHRFRAGELDRATLQTQMGPAQQRLHQLLTQGLDLPVKKVRTFSRELLTLWPALWTYLAIEGVEPTNNAAERALRPAVLWRKGCFGTQSEGGDQFVSRILTVVATCRQQERHVLSFLTEAARAHMTGQPAPKLLVTP